jgi:hypothetical protein
MNKMQSYNNWFWAIPLFTFGALGLATEPSSANSINVTCEVQGSTPTVMATIGEQNESKSITILNFVPEYFSSSEALANCQNTATRLQSLYEDGTANYLTAGKLNDEPAVCTVARRGTDCTHYSAQLLFTLDQEKNSSQVLYDMLGSDFKQASPLDSRTLSRIYSDIKPSFWQRLWQ